MVKIASLIPSGTDLVAALGLGGHLVGVSHECDHPSAGGLPVLTRAAIPSAPSTAPGAVDAAVGTALAEGASLYQADRQLLAELAPDIVVSQDICDVCAVDGPTARASLPPGANLVMLTATSLAGLADDVRAIAKACGAAPAGDELIHATDARLAELQGAAGGRPRPRVLALEWSDPPFLGGHWVPELVALAGGDHVLSGPGDASRRSTWAEIAQADPDVIVFMPCGYVLDDAARELRSLVTHPEVSSLRAVRHGSVWATDATRLFSRCTTSAVVDAAAVLGAILHPGIFGPVPPGAARRI